MSEPLTPTRVATALNQLRELADSAPDGAIARLPGITVQVTTVRFMLPEPPLTPSRGSDKVAVMVVDGRYVAEDPSRHLPAGARCTSVLDLGRHGRFPRLEPIGEQRLTALVEAVESGAVRTGLEAYIAEHGTRAQDVADTGLMGI